jgi:hypothetical protein
MPTNDHRPAPDLRLADGVEADVLGPASRAFPLVGATRVDDALVVVSRNLEPARVLTYDLGSGAVTAEGVVPTGLGAWGVAPDGRGGAVLGAFGAQGGDNLHRYEPATGEVAALGAVPAVYVWALAPAGDGLVLGVTGDPSVAFTLDVGSGAITEVPGTAGGEAPRSCTATDGAFVLGGSAGGAAFLRAVDRSTGAVRDVLPPALVAHQTVYTLATGEGLVVAATRGPDEGDPAVALLDAATLAPVAVVPLPGEALADAIAIVPDAVFVTARGSGALWRLDRDGSAEVVATPEPRTEHRGLWAHAGTLVGAAAGGRIWTADPAAGTSRTADLVADGLVVGGPERSQSLAAAAGRVLVGGTFGLSERRMDDGRTRRVAVPGEPKGIAVAGDTAYLGVYPVGEIWAVPLGQEGAGDPVLAAALPPEQNRPLAVVHEPERDWILVGSAADRAGGGALSVLALASGELEVHVDPLPGRLAVNALALGRDTAYLGGTADGTVGAWDLDAGALRWVAERPLAGAGFTTGVALSDGLVSALTAHGWYLVLDAATGEVRSAERIAEGGGGRMVTARGVPHAVDGDRLLRLDPATGRAAVIVEGLGSLVFGHPFLAADERGELYVIAGTDVVRVTVTVSAPRPAGR